MFHKFFYLIKMNSLSNIAVNLFLKSKSSISNTYARHEMFFLSAHLLCSDLNSSAAREKNPCIQDFNVVMFYFASVLSCSIELEHYFMQ